MQPDTQNTHLRTITVSLMRGLMQGNVAHTEALIREPIVQDELNLPGDNPSSFEAQRAMLFRRVLRIGTISTPGQLLLDQLASIDFAALMHAANEMEAKINAELAQHIGVTDNEGVASNPQQ